MIHRRHFLRGLGISLSLPGFESLAASPNESGPAPRRLVCIGNHLGFYPGHFFPKDAGVDYTPGPTLKPLEAHRADYTVFSNLDHESKGGHSAVHTFLSSVKKQEASGFPEKNMSLDQVAAEHVGSATRYASLTTGIAQGTDMCWTRSGVRIPPINNPARLFQALFVNSDRGRTEDHRRRLLHRSSVLDALRESAGALHQTLNAADRDKLDQYLTSVRDVERRLQMSQAWLDRPKPDSPIAEVLDEERKQIDEVALFYDLIALALQTDSTRVATFEIPIGFRTAELNLGGYHGLSHHGRAKDRIAQLEVVETYFATRLADFFGTLKEAGLFDDTLVVFGSGMGDGSRHSNRNLPVLLAGGGLKHRGHLVCPSEDHKRVPLSNLWLSTLHWFGAEVERLGRSTGTFSPMEVS